MNRFFIYNYLKSLNMKKLPRGLWESKSLRLSNQICLCSKKHLICIAQWTLHSCYRIIMCNIKDLNICSCISSESGRPR
jgi:hypothetical protein